MTTIASALAGLVFGLGLIVSGMANPAKIIGFLDFAGAWDPSLVFVMGGALAVGIGAFALAGRRTVSYLGADMRLPKATARADRRLIAGSVVFGIGWGMAGICPGPGVVLLGMGEGRGVVFVIAMLVGMGVFELIERRQRHRLGTPDVGPAIDA